MRPNSTIGGVAIKVTAIAFALCAQTNESTCDRCSATYVENSEIEAFLRKIDNHIKYLMVRVDPEKIVPLKDAAAAKYDLDKRGKSDY